MTSKLSNKFFGNKKFSIKHYELYQSMQDISDEEISDVFAPYTASLAQTQSQDSTCTLFHIFAEFIRENLRKFHTWEFDKMSSWIQLAAYVFQYSFSNDLTKKQSFNFFTQVLVRHSLFRPPHSVEIFTFEECKQINDFWMGTFCRFYDQYSLCFSPLLNKKISTTYAGFLPSEGKQAERKQLKRDEFEEKFGQKIGVNPLPKAAEEAS